MSSLLPASPYSSSDEGRPLLVKSVTTEAFNFIKNEKDFYAHIHSFRSDSSTLLRITDSKMKRISSGVLLDDILLEVKRPEDADFERKEHSSILNWYKEVTLKSSILDILEFLDHIHIGEERIPLRTVLEEYKKNENDDSEMYVNVRELYNSLFILLCMFLLYLLVLYMIIRFT